MSTRIHRGYRIALVDSDALQRVCTANSLSAMGADSAAFGRVSELAGWIRRGHQFDAVIVGLHADAAKTVAKLPEIEEAVGWPLPVLYLAHHSELESVQRLPSPVLKSKSFRLLASPVDEVALLTWLDALELHCEEVDDAEPSRVSA